jgi:hypothetical protein
MKLLSLALIFLFSIQSGAYCNRLIDGSCYNDDYIGDESQTPGVAVGEPDPYGIHTFPRLHHYPQPLKKRRKPAGGFYPVHAGGQAGDFKEIKPDSPVPPDSLGSQ